MILSIFQVFVKRKISYCWTNVQQEFSSFPVEKPKLTHHYPHKQELNSYKM